MISAASARQPTPTRQPTLWRELAVALRRVALPAVAVAAAIVLLGLLITEVLARGLLAGEPEVGRDIVAERTPTGNTATLVIGYLAATPTIIGLTAAAAVACRIAFRRWRESVCIVLAVTGETLIFLLSTLLVERERPPVPQLDEAPPTSSYPSGHTAAAICYYGTIAAIVLWHSRHALLRGAVVIVAIVVPLLVGASRVYRGMHFPSDVLAGLLLGVAWFSVTTRLVLFRGPSRAAFRWSHPPAATPSAATPSGATPTAHTTSREAVR